MYGLSAYGYRQPPSVQIVHQQMDRNQIVRELIYWIGLVLPH